MGDPIFSSTPVDALGLLTLVVVISGYLAGLRQYFLANKSMESNKKKMLLKQIAIPDIFLVLSGAALTVHIFVMGLTEQELSWGLVGSLLFVIAVAILVFYHMVAWYKAFSRRDV